MQLYPCITRAGTVPGLQYCTGTHGPECVVEAYGRWACRTTGSGYDFSRLCAGCSWILLAPSVHVKSWRHLLWVYFVDKQSCSARADLYPRCMWALAKIRSCTIILSCIGSGRKETQHYDSRGIVWFSSSFRLHWSSTRWKELRKG